MADERYDGERWRTVEHMLKQSDRERDQLRTEISRHNDLITGILTEQRDQRGIIAEIRAESKQAVQQTESIAKDIRGLRADIKTLTNEIHTTDVNARERVAEHAQAAARRERNRHQQEGAVRTKWLVAALAAAVTLVLFLASMAAEFAMRLVGG